MAVIHKRSVFYVLDALVFASILIGTMLLIPPTWQPQEPINFPSTYLAKDIMQIFSTMTMGEVNQTWVTEILNQGHLIDFDDTVLLQLGAFWSQHEFVLANELVYQIIGHIGQGHVGYGVWINDQPLFTTANPPTARYVNSWQVISGVDDAKPIKGFVANARAVTIFANATKIVDISPLGAGWHTGRMVVEKVFNVESASSINGASLVMSIHAGMLDSDVMVNINNGQCTFVRSDFTWMFNDEGDIAIHDVLACVNPGINRIQLDMRLPFYNTHTHPGMQLIIDYVRDFTGVELETQVSKRYYFDDITSFDEGFRSGVWSALPFHIPPHAQDVSVSMQIVGQGIRDYNHNINPWQCDVYYITSRYCSFWSWTNQWRSPNDWDYILFINTNTPADNDPSPPVNPTYRYDPSFMENHLVDGTNVVAVYFNNYGDMAWGTGITRLYSDPVTNPQGSSYVEVNYTIAVHDLPTGTVPISLIQPFSGADHHDKTVSFNYPSQAIEKGDVYLHGAQQYSYRTTVWADTFDPPTTQVFRAPAARIIPTSIFIDSSLFGLSPSINNYIRTRDDNPGNDLVVDASWVEYQFFIPSYVGFGDVFADEQDARDDAADRLLSIISGYLDTSHIQTNVNSIQNVPSLWGPIRIEVRAWQ